MPTIDLFNKTADQDKITAAIIDGSFRFRSKLYVTYLAKNAAEGLVIGAVLGLATIGALVVVNEALTSSTEDTE